MKYIVYSFLILTIALSSCEKEDIIEGSMKAYVSTFGSDTEIHGVIACAANNVADENQFDIFFYPTPGANNFKYFESTSDNIDAWDYNNYKEVVLPVQNVFNGYLRKFIQDIPSTKNWVIVTFEIGGKLYISDPIINRSIGIKTEVNADLITITENNISPTFNWQDGIQTNNDIYFQVISDTNGNLISGTYTREKVFNFYDVSNVVIDINQGNTPTLAPNTDYTFTLMAVDDDNWVNLLAQKEFSTN